MADASSHSKEDRDALRVAEEDENVRAIVGDRGRAVLAARMTGGRRAAEGTEHTVVGIHDHERGTSVVAVVDLAEGKVLEVHETPVQFQLSEEERAEAEAHAAADQRVQGFLDGREMRPLTRLYFPPEERGGDRTHRYAIVFLRPSRGERKYAIVDLTVGAVVDFLALEDLV